MERIKAIPYEQIERKNDLERKLFSELTSQERRVMRDSWLKLLDRVLESTPKRIRKSD